MNKILLVLLVFGLLGCRGTAAGSPLETQGQELRAFALSAPLGTYNLSYFTSRTGQTLPYRMLLPLGYDPRKAYPLLLWLHGTGEMGSNGNSLGNGTEVFARAANLAKYPAIILVPQCPRNDRWTSMSASFAPGEEHMSAQPTHTAAATLELVDTLRGQLNIDPARVLIAGLSVGGFGVYDFLVRRPELFTSGLALSGGGDTAKAAILAKKAIWDIHGSADLVVGVGHSRVLMAAIRAVGGHPQYTEIAGGKHGPWSPIVAEPQVLSWLFR